RHVIFRCVVGSRAYGLEHDDSDTDIRGVYLPSADAHWSLFGVPEQLESDETQECYWELQKFLTLALRANPNILECLYTPEVLYADTIARELLDMRAVFLSRLIYQTFNGYVLSQFKKLEQDLRTRGAIRWKHAMHLIRLLLAGVVALRDGHVPVHVEEHRDWLLAIKRGEMAWEQVDTLRLRLHGEFETAYAETKLPERPDYDRASALLVKARRWRAEGG
ncbi:MAG: nucleotidyltransferase, partial [Planctomycetes bacterium UTPLA1]